MLALRSERAKNVILSTNTLTGVNLFPSAKMTGK